MKNVILIMVVLIGFTMQAQDNDKGKLEARKEMRKKMNNLSPEQKAELATKKMALHLDLTEAQKKKIYPVELEIAQLREAAGKNNEAKKDLSKEELFKRRSEMLDKKSAIKAQYKSILTTEQFEKWEKMSHKRAKGKRKLAHKKRG